MYREAQERRGGRSRSEDRRSVSRHDRREGNGHLRKELHVSKTAVGTSPGFRVPLEENSFDLEFGRHNSVKKESRTPMKALIDKEISKEMEPRRSSPSLVARLMGLDTLPSAVPKKQKERVSSPKTSSVALHKKHIAQEVYPPRTSITEYQECKDVFEVMEMRNVKKQNDKQFWKRTPSSKQIVSGIDRSFSKKATYDEYQSPKEYDDMLEDLAPNEDLFMKFLEEPSSLFKKHLQDLQCSSPPRANHITVLKPSIVKADDDLCCTYERNAGRHPCHVKGNTSSYRRTESYLDPCARKEHSSPLPHISPEQLDTRNPKVPHDSTQIVVLKPSLEKAWDMETTLPLAKYPEYHRYGLKRQKEIPVSRKSEVYGGWGETEFNSKRLRELARDVTQQLKSANSNGSKRVAAAKKHGQYMNGSSFGIFGTEKSDLDTLRWNFDEFDDSGDSLSAASHYSTESSVSREARKRLSTRWKMIQQIQRAKRMDMRSSTLEEILVSDREPSTAQNIYAKSMSRGREVISRRDYPLGNNNNDSWKDEWSRNFLRSKSLRESLLLSQNHKPSRENRVGVSDNSYLETLVNQNVKRRRSSKESFNYHRYESHFYYGREDSEVSEREIHVNSEELCSRVHAREQTEVVSKGPELSQDSRTGGCRERGNLVLQREDVDFPAKVVFEQAIPFDGDISSADPNYLSTKEISADHPHIKPTTSHCDVTESPPASLKEDQPSPVSVLDPSPSDEEKSSSKCFEKVSAGLKELRMQLKLLKLESAGSDADSLELFISSDEGSPGCPSPLHAGELLEAFKDDEDRDFSYLLDVLIDSGVRTTAGSVFAESNMQEFSIGREVFEKLEKKYSVLASWSRSERRLLFDLISSILADFRNPSVDLRSMKTRRFRPSWAHEGLFEDVWQVVVKRRKEMDSTQEEKLLLDPRWLDLGGNVDAVASELEKMLVDELAEELVFQLES